MRNLVFSGGGVKGILHLGALKALEEGNYLKNIKNYGGASAGSIVGFLLYIGYTYNDIMILNLKINIIDRCYELTDIFEFFNIYGLMNYDPGERFLRLLLETKFKKKHMSFKEMHNLTGKTLHINSINVNTKKEIIFNYINTPDIDVVDACLASASLPFIFSPKIINDEYYIDPFAVNNCPCNIFKDDLENTICLRISNCEEKNKILKIDSFPNYIMNVFSSLSNYTYKTNINIYNPHVIINLNYDCSPIDFDLSKEDLKKLFIKGYNITKSYLKDNSDKFTKINEDIDKEDTVINEHIDKEDTIINEDIDKEDTVKKNKY